MLTRINPDTVAPPPSYSHAVEVKADSRLLYVAGQIGRMPDGTILDGFAAQLDQAWRNLEAVLAAAGMGIEDLVKVNEILVDPNDIPACRAKRAAMLKPEHRPAATLMVVQQLAYPHIRFELEAVAAKK